MINLKTNRKNLNFNDFQLVVASVNGSGTLTANRVLHKTLFRHGYQVVGKNLFPSNIEGLPTYYFLRVSKTAKSLKTKNELYIGLNPSTLNRDLKTLVNSSTTFFTNSDLKLNLPNLNNSQSTDQNQNYALSFKASVTNSKANIKIKKRMSNMTYVGWVSRYLNLDLSILKDVIKNNFSSESVTQENIDVMMSGWNEFGTQGVESIQLDLLESLDLNLKNKSNLKKDSSNLKSENSKILIEGNQASALGWVDGGCTLATWYPITPSTSLVESFESFAKSLRLSPTSVAVLQSEDEISAISSVIGAGWAGARAATATSGPGLSLMSEAIGLSYFAEIPSVICDVQRVGPSTGMPTRTSQGDLEFAYKISHGDAFHPVLLPSDPKECFEMSSLAFDIADKYQTPVFVLTDLDLGMNLWSSDEFIQSEKPFERSQILTEIDLENLKAKGEKFKRYLGDDKGIPSRTLPGTHHIDAAYFTRGTSHTETAGYSEHPEDYEKTMNRLKLKIMNSRMDLPEPKFKNSSKKTDDKSSIKNQIWNSKIGILYYGSTSQIFPELQDLISEDVDLCEVKSLPLHDQVFEFVKSHEKIFVIEQNRDGQLKSILMENLSLPCSTEIISILNYTGWSIQADQTYEKMAPYFVNTKKI